MIFMYIGIDPSINSTGICIQCYNENNERNSIKFYIVHGGKLKKKELLAENKFIDIFEYVCYDKQEIKEFKGKDNNKFELTKTQNLLNIVDNIVDIICKEERKIHIKYPGKDIQKYITIEANSFNSRNQSVSLIELCGLNYLIRNAFFDKPLTELIIGTPSELKKYATSRGNADKELIELIFKTEFSDLVNSDIKTDDIADAFFMSNFSKKYNENICKTFVQEHGLEKLVKNAVNKNKEVKRLKKDQEKLNKQLQQNVKNQINPEIFDCI